jgi:hypothetical protein
MISQKVLTKVSAIPNYLQSILPSIRNFEETGSLLTVDSRQERRSSVLANQPSTKVAKRASRDFSFSGSGFLAAFHLGAASSLIKRGILTKHSKLAGASGGALIGQCSHRNEDVAIQSILTLLCDAQPRHWQLICLSTKFSSQC